MHTMSFQETPTDSKSRDEEMRGTKRKISLSNCGVCGFGEAKYKCPACLTHSCSLLCVKKHKEESRCSGVRNKTAFLNLSQFDEITLLSDYRFLEDTGRFAGGAQRDNLIRVPHASMRAKKLIVNARKMNITLRTLPSTFTKSKENSTIFNFRYHKMDLQKSLRDNLSYKILIEYPSLHVVLSDHWTDFPLKGPAEPPSAYDKCATKSVAVDHASEDLTLRSPSLHCSRTTRGNILRKTQSSPESLPPREKRVKRELGEEELEEGEIADSEDEEKKEENSGKNTTLIKLSDGANSKD
ncbi:uncharacterized protein znhit6 isoform X4 [Phyllopteryx taeniolatus]|uniref:uncharacterized protein znhit6 isoform X4 n=1 Tax=Phyllopteryx taeniolatus TaxID=161469 RepID=UPI002AD539DB|nr:uncharacterized protein znhit6 isoform X4 [Phyllopteryx taeniolatus]